MSVGHIFIANIMFYTKTYNTKTKHNTFSFPSIEVNDPVFSVSTLDYTSLRPLAPVAHGPITRATLYVTSRFAKSSDTLALDAAKTYFGGTKT